MWRIRVTAGLLLLTATASAMASQLVLFEDGRVLEIEGATFRGSRAELTLVGGGRISIPASRIANRQALGPVPGPTPVEARGPEVEPPLEPWEMLAGEFAGLIGDAAERHGVAPELLAAMAHAESNFDPLAVSHKGARGLLQLMPATAQRFGVQDPLDVAQNVDGGARYLRWLLERYDGQAELAVAGYNAGEAAVDRHRGIPPYPETQRYVKKVLRGADRLVGAPRP